MAQQQTTYASMRPRQSSLGIHPLAPKPPPTGPASMRPRQSSLGIQVGQRTVRCVLGASMRPRQSSLGICGRRCIPCRTSDSFNEAEAIKPRNRRGPDRWASAKADSFNEAEAIKPRNPCSQGNTECTNTGFNEAEAIKPRNRSPAHSPPTVLATLQ